MPHTSADAFLQAILQAPDDDTPRLVYADWLEEQGEPAGVARAEFIRIQCALAREHSTALASREQQLLERYGDVWSAPVSELARKWQFHRGFIEAVTIGLEIFLRRARKLFAHAPVRHLYLRSLPFSPSQAQAALAGLSACPYVQRVQTLDLHGNSLDSAAVESLSVAEHFTQLTFLNLSDNRIGDAGIRALSTAPFFPLLTNLDLSRNNFTPSGIRHLIKVCERLAASPSGLRLRQLALRGNHHTNTVQRLIASSPLFRNIVRS